MVKKFYAFIDKFSIITGMIAMFLMIAIVFVQVFSRYVLGTSIRWSEEISRYLMLYLVFLGLGMGTQDNKHLGVDAFVSMIPVKSRKYMEYVTIFITIAIYILFFYYSLDTVIRISATNQASPGARIPMGFVYAIFPFGFSLGIIWQIKRLIDLFFHGDSSGNNITGKEV